MLPCGFLCIKVVIIPLKRKMVRANPVDKGMKISWGATVILQKR